MQKRISLLLVGALLCLVSSIFAEVPQMMNYQGRLIDNLGNPAADGDHQLVFTIYNASEDIVWQETHGAVHTTNGLFNVLLGGGDHSSYGELTAEVFSDSTRWLGITIGAYGVDPEVDPRTKIITVPYAYRVATVDGASGGTITSDLDIPAALTVERPDPGPAIHITGSGFTGGSNIRISDNYNSTEWGIGSNADGFQITERDLAAHLTVEETSGNVGIGNSYPTERLDVDGNIVVSGKATIGSGHTNTGAYAFVAGMNNTGSDDYATVGGGQDNTASDTHAAVGGGGNNMAGGGASTVAGGVNDTASAHWSTICGGATNVASGEVSFVGGGARNRARGLYSVVCGGGGATLADSNSAIGDYSFIGGGTNNSAGGMYAAVPGGVSNAASADYSFAAGRRAKAEHDGAFVWADSANADFSSTDHNQFLIRASGGVGIGTDSPDEQLTVDGNVHVTGNLIVDGHSPTITVIDYGYEDNVPECGTREVVFNVTFAGPPVVIAGYKGDHGCDEHGNWFVFNVTATGFTLRNGRPNAPDLRSAYWIAVGQAAK
jgi:hypothetical protein